MHCLVEADECNADTAPGEQVGGGDKTGEPVEDLSRAGSDGQVGKDRDSAGDADAVNWDTTLCALEEELRSLASLGKSIEITGTGVEESVTGRSGRGQDDSVDDVWKNLDSGAVDGNNPWRSGSVRFTVEEIVVIVWNENTDSEGTENVEEEDTPEDTTNGLGDVLAWVLGLTSSDGDHLDTTVREGSLDKGGEKTKESTPITSCNVGLHGTWVLPVTETNAITGWATTKIEDECKEDETDNCDQLDTGEDEFCFTIDGDSEDVQGHDENDDQGNPDCIVHGIWPVLNEQYGSGNFDTEGDGAVVPLIPADSETKSIIDVAGAHLWDSTRKWKPSSHLTKRHHHAEDSETGKSVTNESTEWTGSGESATDTDEETSTDGTTEGNELNVSRLETSGNVTILLGSLDITKDADGLSLHGGSEMLGVCIGEAPVWAVFNAARLFVVCHFGMN